MKTVRSFVAGFRPASSCVLPPEVLLSPILVRPVREQLEHDRVIRLLQAKYKRKSDTAINPGHEQNAPVGGPPPWYPDLVLQTSDIPLPVAKPKGTRYTPIAKRQDKPDGIAWLVRNHPELSDGQISKLLGTTKPTIAAVRDRTHWNSANIKPRHPVGLGLCTLQELDDAVARALRGKRPAGDKDIGDEELGGEPAGYEESEAVES